MSFHFQLKIVLLVLLHMWTAQCQPNVLLIVADDLRTDINCYFQGDDQPPQTHPPMHTPSLDALAEDSLLFKRAYVQYALCAPSRTSFLTSRRPDTTQVFGFDSYWRDISGNFTTLPQYFKDQDYKTLGFGKIFHGGISSGNDDPISWTQPVFRTSLDQSYYRKMRHDLCSLIPDEKLKLNPLPDQVVANEAIKALRTLAHSTEGQPFFMAVGFVKPHTPFQYTDEFVNYYNNSDMPLPANKYLAEGAPRLAYNIPHSLSKYKNIKRTEAQFGFNISFPDEVIQAVRAGYYRAASFVDSMIGRLLDELSALNLKQSTIVAFISDHGFHLGEQGTWLKHTNFEVALRAPMIIRAPGLTDGGLQTRALVELVDLFPTLVDLAGLPSVPACQNDGIPVELCTEGKSLLSLFHDPEFDMQSMAFSQFLRENIMGYSIRNDRHRYTEWVRIGSDFTDVQAQELYDHEIDEHETINRAHQIEYADILSNLSRILRGKFQPSSI